MNDAKTVAPDGDAEGRELAQLLVWLLVGAALLVALAGAAYFMRFGPLGFSNEQEHWGLFGDYLGGAVNPILGFLTLIALLSTIRLQYQQLAVSRKELKDTRADLARTAVAQEVAATALRTQTEAAAGTARLTASIALLEHTRSEMNAIREQLGTAAPPFQELRALAEMHLAEILKELENFSRRPR